MKLTIHPPKPLKAGYTASVSPRGNTFTGYSCKCRSPRRQGQRPHAVADRPILLNPLN